MTDATSRLTDECWRACYHGGVIEPVEALLDAGVDINARAPCSDSAPLDASICGGHTALTEYLVERGADVNGVGYADYTALMMATNQVQPNVVELLLRCGADPNLPSPVTGQTPLHVTTDQGFSPRSNECLRQLLDAGANPNVATTPGKPAGTFPTDSVKLVGETPLHLAAAYGDAEMIRMLLEAGADRAATDANGLTPFIWYARHRRHAALIQISRDQKIGDQRVADKLRPE